MRVLFIMRHSGYVRNFESTLRLLCERKHEVHLAFQAKERHWLLDTTDIAQQLAGQYPNFTQGTVPLRTDEWAQLGVTARLGLDFLRYLGPEYREATKLRQRVERQVEPAIARIAQRGVAGRSGLAAVLRQVDRSIPRDPEIDAYFRLQRPDLVLVTPLVEPGSPQIDYLRSAKAMGARTVYCVASWDNLTNKGLIHEPVDLVTVWNDSMKAEAIRMHGVPPERVAVTGAQPFDHWFDWRPSTSRADFCARVGLDPEQPYLLYVCSSKFVAREEAPFVGTWAQQLRASGSDRLRKVGILVRPHPQNWEQWGRFDRSGLTNFTVHPFAGAAPVDERTRSEYFDSIYHSAAIVGINTTAEIESAIVGRRVFTVLDPAFKDTQEGTLHFHYLRHVNGGLLNVARDLSEHAQQLDAALAAGTDDDGRCRRFVEAFVRPFGVNVSATPRLVQAIEDVAGRPGIPRRALSLLAPVIRPLVRPVAARLHREAEEAARAQAKRDAIQAARRARRAKLAAEGTPPAEIAQPRS